VRVLVDTSLWSLALRRQPHAQNSGLVAELAALIEDNRVVIIGPIRQEILSGIKEPAQFEKLRTHLHAFPDLEITSVDYEEAAAHFNRCRAKGVQGSNTDFLICAVAARRELSIFTADEDFKHFAKILPIALHQVNA
jgi:predicted nucleic acid-binding protein